MRRLAIAASEENGEGESWEQFKRSILVSSELKVGDRLQSASPRSRSVSQRTSAEREERLQELVASYAKLSTFPLRKS